MGTGDTRLGGDRKRERLEEERCLGLLAPPEFQPFTSIRLAVQTDRPIFHLVHAHGQHSLLLHNWEADFGIKVAL